MNNKMNGIETVSGIFADININAHNHFTMNGS